MLARTTASQDWQAAAEGEHFSVGGGARTGDESRARIDISDGSIIRLGANTEFELRALSPEPTDPITTLRLEAGKVWVFVSKMLGTGTFEIETPSGVATVRGSLMSVAYDPVTGQMTVTCLEGQCRLTGAGGQATDLIGGEQTEIAGSGQPPTSAQANAAAALTEWAQEFPQAQSVVLTITPAPDELPKLASGVYQVSTLSGGRQNDGIWTLQITEGQITGASEWACCPDHRVDPLTGHIDGDQIIIERNCSGQGYEGECHQVFSGTLEGDTIVGSITGTGIPESGATWTLYLNP